MDKSTRIVYRVEGYAPADGEWHMLDEMLPEGDHMKHAETIRDTLRQFSITRYVELRVMRYVTEGEQVGTKLRVK